jgi:hypothetical protein
VLVEQAYREETITSSCHHLLAVIELFDAAISHPDGLARRFAVIQLITKAKRKMQSSRTNAAAIDCVGDEPASSR